MQTDCFYQSTRLRVYACIVATQVCVDQCTSSSLKFSTWLPSSVRKKHFYPVLTRPHRCWLLTSYTLRIAPVDFVVLDVVLDVDSPGRISWVDLVFCDLPLMSMPCIVVWPLQWQLDDVMQTRPTLHFRQKRCSSASDSAPTATHSST